MIVDLQYSSIFQSKKQTVRTSMDLTRQQNAPHYSGATWKDASTLFDICVHYVAENLNNVENFINFPDVVGLKLFQTAASKDMFHTYANSVHRRALKLFCDAYKEQVLSALDASERPWLSADVLEAFCIFSNLTKLNLSGCQLGIKQGQIFPVMSTFVW